MDFPNSKLGLTEITPCNPWSMVYWTKAKYVKFLQDGIEHGEYIDNSHLWNKRK